MKAKMFIGMMLAAAAAAVLQAPNAQAATFVVDFDLATGRGTAGNAGNSVITRNLGAAAHVTGIAFKGTVTTDWHWLVTQSVDFGASVMPYVALTPGYKIFDTGSIAFDGSIDLVDAGLDFFLENDGILRIEFIDAVQDEQENPTRWTNGRFTIDYEPSGVVPGALGAVPEPASWMMMIAGMAAIGGALRRRRHGHAAAPLVSD